MEFSPDYRKHADTGMATVFDGVEKGDGMRRTDRLFEVIQILRAARAPLTGAEIAEMLEVSKRTIYRDIATLQGMRTPIEGAPGIGFVIRRGYDLPPVNFDVDEAEAITVGLSMIARTGDAGLWAAARRAARKLSEAAPRSDSLIASSWGTIAPENVDTSIVRDAIRSENKLWLRYEDAKQQQSERVVWPLALIYYAENTVLVAWCEKQEDFRHFRLDRVAEIFVQEDRFLGEGKHLRNIWENTLKEQSVTTR